MKITRIVLLALLLLGTFAGMGSAAVSVSAGVRIGPSGGSAVDLGFFYDDLAAYGSWVQRPSYGWVWTPSQASSSWRPYQEGHWVETDEGWTWISDEPYGWATYHYGRWYQDPEYGWEWVPGNEWAPAWVSWQEGGDYVGWAPLPPSARWSGGGFGGVDFSTAIAPEAYLFVPERQFLAPRLDGYYVQRGGERNIFRQTRNVTNYRVVNNRIINQGLAVERVQQVIGRPVPRYQIGDLGADQRHHGGQVQANRVSLFRPRVEKANVAPPPERSAARRSVRNPGDNQAARPNQPAPTDIRQRGVARQNRQADRPAAPQNIPGQAQARQPRRPQQNAPAPAAEQPQPQASRRQRPQAAQKQQPQPQQQPQHQQRPPRQQRPPQQQAAPNDRPHGQAGQGRPQGQPQGKPQGRPQGNPKDRHKPPQDPGR
ncbi:MAG: hypothetical protein QOJ16_444 [Acidobacteriota bacterium]|jgi:hypothetical protein|nr:hypothetical protein [Acidobacteriota bacterium]